MERGSSIPTRVHFFAAGLLEQGQAGGAAGQVHQAQHRSADCRLPGPSVEGQHLT